MDLQGAFHALTTQFPVVIIDVGGAGDYVSKVDVKICHIKERYRSVKVKLPWKLPPALIVRTWLHLQHHILTYVVLQHFLFTGLCMNYKKEFSLSFGDYAEVYDGTDNMAHSCHAPCIALYQCNNMTGSWTF